MIKDILKSQQNKSKKQYYFIHYFQVICPKHPANREEK